LTLSNSAESGKAVDGRTAGEKLIEHATEQVEIAGAEEIVTSALDPDHTAFDRQPHE
jgi:hypothetical protein